MVSMAHKRSAADQLRTLQKGNEKKNKKTWSLRKEKEIEKTQEPE